MRRRIRAQQGSKFAQLQWISQQLLPLAVAFNCYFAFHDGRTIHTRQQRYPVSRQGQKKRFRGDAAPGHCPLSSAVGIKQAAAGIAHGMYLQHTAIDGG
ncbi:hypothetical protein D3C81_1693300 [compost metagenome]